MGPGNSGRFLAVKPKYAVQSAIRDAAVMGET